MSTGHVCDPTGGKQCPPWAHPYASTDEVLARQNKAAAAQLAARRAQPPRERSVVAPSWSIASRVVDGLLTQLERLAKRGYQITKEQEWRLWRLAWTGTLTLPASAWEGSAIPPESEPDPDFARVLQRFGELFGPDVEPET